MAVSACALLLMAGCERQREGESEEMVDDVATTGFVEVNGAMLYFEEKGSGPPLVLLHSANTNLHIWDGQFDFLARNHRTVRYDARGFGRSRSELVDFTDYEDLRLLLDHLGIDRTVLVGLSLGGMTAFEFALEYPERVSSLVLAGAGLNGFEYSFSEEERERFAEIRRAAAEGDLEVAASLGTEAYFNAPERPWSEVRLEIRETVKDMFLQSEDRFALNSNALHHFLEPKAIERVAEIQAPLLVILGEHESPNEYGIANILENNIPNVQRAIIPGAKHLTSMENPEAFNRAVYGFLAETTN